MVNGVAWFQTTLLNFKLQKAYLLHYPVFKLTGNFSRPSFFFSICASFTSLWKNKDKMTAIPKNSILIVITSNDSFPLLRADSVCSSPNGTVQDSLPFLFRLALPFQVSSEACNENMQGCSYFHKNISHQTWSFRTCEEKTWGRPVHISRPGQLCKAGSQDLASLGGAFSSPHNRDPEINN